MQKRLTAAFLCLCLLFTLLPATAFAEGEPDSGPPPAQSALCEHHPQHDESCGYTEGTEGSPCSHEHTEDCYTLVTECVHEHTTECYPAESVSENTATPSEPEEAEPTACTHVCSEESGCITKALDCKHEHDEACGYVPATEGTPCTFACEVCNPQDSGNPATPSDAQPEKCTCETLCTGDNINGNCPVCGAEGADLNECEGLESQPATPSNALPATALAAAPEHQVIYVGGVEISSTGYWTTSEDGQTITSVGDSQPSSGGYIHYDADDNTLTLHNATIKKQLVYSENIEGGTYIFGAAIGVLNQNGDAELTITLAGTNTIAEVGKGIFVLASSTSTGGATLTITGGGSLDASASQTGIWVQSNSNNAALCVKNAEVTASADGAFKNGVLVQAKEGSDVSLTVNGGSLTASVNANIWFQFGSGASGSGTPTVTVSNNAIVRANGGIANNSSSPIQYETGSDSTGGIVFDGKNGTVYGSVTLQEDITIGEGESLTLDDGASLNAGNHNVIVDGGTLGEGFNLGDSVKYAPTITTESLSNGNVGTLYNATLAADGDATITWSSSDLPEWLTLDIATGVISGTPTTAGTSTFTVKAENSYGSDSKQLSIAIDAQTNVPVTGVSLDQSALTLTEDGTAQLTATVQPSNAINKGVTWSSDNETVATVQNGTVTAVKEGTATITVTTADGGFTDTCEVTVTAKTYGISVSPSALDFGSMTEGYQAAPAAQTVTITNTGNQTVTVNLPASTNYTVTAETGFTGGTATLSPNGTATFTVQPKTGLATGSYDETLTISGDNNTSANIALSFEVDVNLYSVTVNGSYAQTTGTGSYAEGATVAIDAGTRSGYTFDGWTSSDGVTFANAGIAQTTFTMPDKAVTVTANWTKKSSGGGGSSSSSGGGSYTGPVGVYYADGGNDSIPSDATQGNWEQETAADGSISWRFKLTDGSYAADRWIKALWNDQYLWYHTDAGGYLQGGWFTDTDGNIYYLHPFHDGNFGYMYTGDHVIDGVAYSFSRGREQDGLPEGAMKR